MKNRKISAYVQEQASKPFGRILVFTGARQTGKTTLVRDLFPDYEYLSIEDPVTRNTYSKLNASQWKTLYPRAILDEVQKEPQLIESIKSVYDQWPEPRYLLLGSSQLLLMQQVKESLAGRCTIVELFPLTLPELSSEVGSPPVPDSLFQLCLRQPLALPGFLPHFSLDKGMVSKQQSYDHYLKFGGYPAISSPGQSDNDRFLWLKNYVRTYLERDIRDLASFRDLDPFVKLQHQLAVNTGNLVNASSLATSLGMTAKTVQRYLRYFELSYQALVLPSWSRNEGKRLVKAPKVHYLDHGVLQAVLQRRGAPTGPEFESLVVAELYKQTRCLNVDARFFHFRTQDGREVDLLIELPEGYLAFEVKMGDRVSTADSRHLRGLAEFLDKPLLHSFILSQDPETRTLGEQITALNVAYFLG